ncbi:hypothetical protein CVT24_012869 [Panaeolus cyanescens]|uniref:Uncharacterized protein n=1 Tax=Panaeolus cyanescens TaxID=181874 RepID=A0A409X4K9_9AGAR|nr:hypothetical protein CVT24_012869 [Panaeolus cyanescens]
MVNNPQTQKIPLVLEKPSFEPPHEVFGNEVEILHIFWAHLKEQQRQRRRVIATWNCGGWAALEADVEEIHHAVKAAEKNDQKPLGAKT